MSDKPNLNPRDHVPDQRAEAAPTTQQMRTVGQRRREAEQKLGHHLDEARHKNDHHDTADPNTDTGKASGKEVDAVDVAAVQSDDRLTAADRVDLIANQAIPETENKGPQPDNGNA
jgi:hypothetical protein